MPTWVLILIALSAPGGRIDAGSPAIAAIARYHSEEACKAGGAELKSKDQEMRLRRSLDNALSNRKGWVSVGFDAHCIVGPLW